MTQLVYYVSSYLQYLHINVKSLIYNLLNTKRVLLMMYSRIQTIFIIFILMMLNGAAIHTMIVYKVEYVGSQLEIILAAHTGSTKSAQLSSRYNQFGGSARVFRM